MSALLCTAALFAAGCHRNNLTSGYGIAWVTLTDEPGDFASYIVNVDSITLTRNDGAVVTALGTIETVDFSKLGNVAEMWGSATIPVGTYVSASIALDYTNAVIAVMVNGVPQKATVVNSAGAAVTTQTINVILDPAGQLTVPATYATTAAERLAVDFNLALSSSINFATNPVTVTVRPYLTAGIAAPDQKLIRIRGPLINSAVNLDTYTVYVRPFFDEVDSLGSLTLFADANTIYANNGVVTTGTPGITQVSHSSTGTTLTASYTTYQPTATPTATAGKFLVKYMVAGSTLEDVYTQGIEGDVVARTGNSLQLRGATVQFNNGTSTFSPTDSTVLLGPGTIVTADDSPVTGLNYNSVGVGQHIIARGIYSLPNSVVTLDATGASATNTGSVRLISTGLWGYVAGAGGGGGGLTLNLQAINGWPVSDFAFQGNGTSAATDPVAATYPVATAAPVPTVPVTPSGVPVWVDGLVAPFGAAPPAFTATAVSGESAVPASLRISWSGAGASAPFTATPTATSMTIDLTNANFASGEIRIGPESIPLTPAPGATVQIVPQAGSGAANLPATFTPLFSFGNPAAVAPAGISVFSAFGTFASNLVTALASTPAVQLEARGTYDRASNTFSASSVSVVL